MQHSILDGWGDMYFRCRNSVVAAHLLVDLRSRARTRVYMWTGRFSVLLSGYCYRCHNRYGIVNCGFVQETVVKYFYDYFDG
jgi:hypothetical protein